MILKVVSKLKKYLYYHLKYKKNLPSNPMHDDIYLVEFPKSGITWLQFILVNIELRLLGITKEFPTFYNIHKYSPDVHQLRGSYINRNLKRTFIKSHSLYNPRYYFVIYLLRNPFDVMVSYYNFMINHGYNKEFKEFVKSRKYGISAWKKHVQSWWYNKLDAQRILFIRYEDLLSDPIKKIKELYENIGVNLNIDIIHEALEQSNISLMRNSEELYRKYNPNYKGVFIGKKGKISKELLMSNEIKEYIYNESRTLLDIFYSDLNF